MNISKITIRVLYKIILVAGLFLLTFLTAFAEEGSFKEDLNFAQVESARLVYRDDGRWDIYVAVRHNDEGWNHYANVWQVVDADTGKIIGERILAHPHDTEQPFTRSLTGLVIPEEVRNIRIRARCNLHDFGGKEISYKIPGNITKGSYSIVLD